MTRFAPLQLVLLALAGGGLGCAADTAPAPEPASSEAATQPAPLGMPPELRACIPPAALRDAGDVELVGTLPDGPDQLVLYSVYPRGEAVVTGEYRDYTARRAADGTCTPLDDWRDHPVSPETQRLYASEAMMRSRARIDVRRAGGAEAFGAAYRAATLTDGPYACPSESPRSGCLSGAYLEALRQLGVEVLPPPSR